MFMRVTSKPYVTNWTNLAPIERTIRDRKITGGC